MSVTSMYIHRPDENLSTAERICCVCFRPDKNYSMVEAHVLDLALILHMEHGGGNNSTFPTHASSHPPATDTYSVVAAALASLKGTETRRRQHQGRGDDGRPAEGSS